MKKQQRKRTNERTNAGKYVYLTKANELMTPQAPGGWTEGGEARDITCNMFRHKQSDPKQTKRKDKKTHHIAAPTLIPSILSSDTQKIGGYHTTPHYPPVPKIQSNPIFSNSNSHYPSASNTKTTEYTKSAPSSRNIKEDDR